MPELYQALQRGVVDGGMYPVETNKGWRMAEVVKYCTQNYANAYTTTFYVVMNKDQVELPAQGRAGDHHPDQPGVDPQARRGLGQVRPGGSRVHAQEGPQVPVPDPRRGGSLEEGHRPGAGRVRQGDQRQGRAPAKEALEFTQKKLAEVNK